MRVLARYYFPRATSSSSERWRARTRCRTPTTRSTCVHVVGQCLSFLVAADQKPGDYLLVASTRFMKESSSITAVIRYAGSNTPASPKLLEGPTGWACSINQWRINITRTLKLSISKGNVNGKDRYGLNGVSHVDTDTPLNLAEYFNATAGVF
ncbi:hypothetical protein GUJ93_ZPchr0001g31480 [Zizania palustris]|uniref:Plastocyanin-like domain-containing protein n=1 Tax=Zizania palustris TaxID=103762 RepID=A0A8J5RUN0_ZIZPA|nr:hypothetical protein GUJ93_ZPchr0001g31480 [Zizania palustris]